MAGPPQQLAPPGSGWYPDPGGRHELRWWDGRSWTPGVADGGHVHEEPLPAFGGPGPRENAAGGAAGPASRPDERALLPLRAGGIGVAAVALATVLGSALALLITGGHRAHLLPALLVGQGTLWAGMLGSCVFASHRYGTGSVRRDLGLALRWVDVGWGLLAAVVGRIVAGIVVALLAAADQRLVGSNTGLFDDLRSDRAAFLTLAVMAAVGAPLFEELFFRGLMLRSFQRRLGVVGAVVAQAAVFGLVHVQITQGLQNVSIMLSTGLLGLLLGALAQRFRRLGPGMATHFFFNLVVVVVLLSV